MKRLWLLQFKTNRQLSFKSWPLTLSSFRSHVNFPAAMTTAHISDGLPFHSRLLSLFHNSINQETLKIYRLQDPRDSTPFKQPPSVYPESFWKSEKHRKSTEYHIAPMVQCFLINVTPPQTHGIDHDNEGSAGDSIESVQLHSVRPAWIYMWTNL